MKLNLKNTLRKHIYREYINGNNFDFNNFGIRQKQGTNCMSSISLFIKKITKPKPNPKHGGKKRCKSDGIRVIFFSFSQICLIN